MLELLGLDRYSPDFLVATALGVVIGGLVIGHITDTLMSDRGFGPYGNGFLVILGAVVGIYTRNAMFGWLPGRDLVITASFAAAMATLILLFLGFAKHWVQD